MSSASQICHNGIVTNILHDVVEVTIEAKSACSSCHVKSACQVSDMEEKVVQVKRNTDKQYEIGQTVQVTLARQKGFEALFFGYLLPFVLLFVTLLIASKYTSELYAGLLSLSVLVPYYGVLYLLKDTMRRRFLFQIESI